MFFFSGNSFIHDYFHVTRKFRRYLTNKMLRLQEDDNSLVNTLQGVLLKNNIACSASLFTSHFTFVHWPNYNT